MQLTEEQRILRELANEHIDNPKLSMQLLAVANSLAAHSAGAQEPVAWAVYNGWSKIAFYISEEGARDHAKAAQRSHDLSGSLAAFRVVPLYAHPPAAAASEDLTRPEWADCETRGSMIRNSLKHRASELKEASNRCRKAYRGDYMRIPCEWLADAYDEAVKLLERRLAAIASQKEQKECPPSK